MPITELWSVGLVGGAIGVALAMPVLRLTSGSTASDSSWRLLGAGLLGLGVIQMIIALRHGGVLADPAAEHVGNLVGLSIFPLLVIWTRGVMRGWPTRTRGDAALWLPAASYATFVVLSSGRHVPFAWILPFATGFSLLAGGVWLRARHSSEASPAMVRLVGSVIAFALSLNVAQAIRTLWPDQLWFREVVPLTATIGLLALASGAMSHLVRARGERPSGVKETPRYARSALSDEAGFVLLAALDRAMADDRLFARPKLTLSELAAHLNVSSSTLSEALNRVRGVPLADYLAELRVQEARRQLADPANDRFTIEALAEASGFASRSAFYKVFRRATGVTPTEFRARTRSS